MANWRFGSVSRKVVREGDRGSGPELIVLSPGGSHRVIPLDTYALARLAAEAALQLQVEARRLRTAARRLREASAGDGEDYAAALEALMAAVEEVG